MRRHCSGSVILFSMREDNELVERWVHRGRKAVMLQKGDLGEMMVIREGRRTMPIAWVHQLPATFEGRARMMVQNSLAAAAAAHAAGAHLHDIRQGLRSFSTSTAAAGPFDPSLAYQLTQRVADGDQAAAISCSQLALGGQTASRPELARFERSLKVEIHLVVQRDGPNLELEPCHRPPSAGSRQHRNLDGYCS